MGYDLRWAGRAFGWGGFLVAASVQREAKDVGVVVDPAAHLAPADGGGDVVDGCQADGAGDRVVVDGLISGKKRAEVLIALDEGVDGIAISGDRREFDAAEFIFKLMALVDAARGAPGGFAPGEFGIVDA